MPLFKIIFWYNADKTPTSHCSVPKINSALSIPYDSLLSRPFAMGLILLSFHLPLEVKMIRNKVSVSVYSEASWWKNVHFTKLWGPKKYKVKF